MMKTRYNILLLLLFFAIISCSSNSDGYTLRNQTGDLIWGGSPAYDGTGLTFETETKTFGIPGTKEDYSDYFSNEKNSVQLKADIWVTGETTIRGWGTQFPEAEIITAEHHYSTPSP